MPPASYSYFQSWQNEPRGRLFKGRKAENAALTRKASLFSPNNDQDVSGRSVDYGSNDLRLDPSLKAENIQIAPDLKNNQPIEARPDEDLKPKGFGGLFGGQGAKEPGIISKILQVGLPALTGLAGGVGILPGLLTGYAGMKAGEYKRQDDALDRQLKQDALNKPSETERLFQNYKGMSDEDRALYGQFQSLRQPAGLTPYQAAMLDRADKRDAREAEKPPKIDPNTPEQIFIRDAIHKMTNKQTILNTLQSTLAEYKDALNKGDEQAAYTIGQRALKVMNSTEGADAIGEGEATRLSPQLNMFRTPFQLPGDLGVGRKLPEFGQSLQDTINILQKSIDESAQQIKDPSKVLDGRDKSIGAPYSQDDIEAEIRRRGLK